jgi:EAL domain-containing protein (putative c-di-GMP-specific phosphodiesterase class I)
MHVADPAPLPDRQSDPAPRILLVDDDDQVLRGYTRLLQRAGYIVQPASSGDVALKLLETESFDSVVSDICMPEISGVDLLKAIRERDLDVPVLLMTATPHVASAMDAIQYGAIAYLAKPVDRQALEAALARAVRLHRLARLKREAAALVGDDGLRFGDRASLERAFEHALATLWVAFQPIVSLSQREVVAYEALLRTEEKLLPHPGAVLAAATRLERLHEVGRATRAQVAAQMGEMPCQLAFVNLHAHDLLDEELYSPAAPLSAFASRVVLEITERASLDEVRGCDRRAGELRRLGYRLAVDDLGAGYAGLNSFVQLEPDVVKFDMSLIRDIDKSPIKHRLVDSMTALFKQMGKLVVAEGVETEAERDTLHAIGCDLLQGYLFARPARGFPPARW